MPPSWKDLETQLGSEVLSNAELKNGDTVLANANCFILTGAEDGGMDGGRE